MVYETRKVVEDYVLYKIKQHLTSVQSDSTILHNGAMRRSSSLSYPQFPQPQEPPSDINNAVRKVAYDFEKLYQNRYPDLMERIRADHVATRDVDQVFTQITKDLFKITYKHGTGASASGTSSPMGSRKVRTPSPALVESDIVESSTYTIDDSNVKWGHVIALLVFTGVLAVRCVEINNNQQVDDIVNWVTKFLDTKLGLWLNRHGGWDGFVLWHRQSKGAVDGWLDVQSVRNGLRTALRVSGAVAAVALGAMVLSRK